MRYGRRGSSHENAEANPLTPANIAKTGVMQHKEATKAEEIPTPISCLSGFMLFPKFHLLLIRPSSPAAMERSGISVRCRAFYENLKNNSSCIIIREIELIFRIRRLLHQPMHEYIALILKQEQNLFQMLISEQYSSL